VIQQWKEKFKGEADNRMVLDENLRILGRRINDLELDIEDKKEKIRLAESQNAFCKNLLHLLLGVAPCAKQVAPMAAGKIRLREQRVHWTRTSIREHKCLGRRVVMSMIVLNKGLL
jgi:hypothetical protein